MKMSHSLNHELYTPDCNTNNICISKRQDMIISVCRSKIVHQIMIVTQSLYIIIRLAQSIFQMPTHR